MSNDHLETPLTDDQTTLLLQTGLAGASRPIDDLIDRLCRPDGATWLSDAIASGTSESHVSMLIHGPVDSSTILRIKGASKSGMARATTQKEMLRALAGYCVSVASGLVHLKQLASSQRGSEWADALGDLAAAVDTPWREFFTKAAEQALRLSP
jgi:hypothetical protein